MQGIFVHGPRVGAQAETSRATPSCGAWQSHAFWQAGLMRNETTSVAVIAGAAIIDDNWRVLAAERAEPPHTAGMWEFPGGKVEHGETETEAAIRECREELGVEVTIADRLGEDVVLPSGAILRIWMATLRSGIPQALEHGEIRWLSADQLDDVPWLPADLPLVAQLRQRLQEKATPVG